MKKLYGPRLLTLRAMVLLHELIAYMRKQAPETHKHFNMGAFLDHRGWHEIAREGTRITRTHVMDCGTSACALGFAAVKPKFQELGLEMRWEDSSYQFRVKGRGYSPFEAAKKFFDIGYDDAKTLFGNISYIRTPKQWAEYAHREIGPLPHDATAAARKRILSGSSR